MQLVFPLLFNRKVVYTAEELAKEINKFNGKINCMISFYGFGSVHQNKPVWEDVLIDKLLIECNNKECIELIKKGKEHHIFYLGNNQFYYIIPIKKRVNRLRDIALEYEKDINKELGLNVSVNLVANKMVLMPNTFNLETKKFVIPIKDTELNNLKKLNKLGDTQRIE